MAKKPTTRSSKSPPNKGRKRSVSALARKYVTGILSGKTKKQAALDAGYAPSTADNAKQKIERPAVRELFTDVLEKAGATDEKLAKRIAEGLDATVVARETKHASREVLIDFSERRETGELLTKLKGYLVQKLELRDKTLEQILEDSNE